MDPLLQLEHRWEAHGKKKEQTYSSLLLGGVFRLGPPNFHHQGGCWEPGHCGEKQLEITNAPLPMLIGIREAGSPVQALGLQRPGCHILALPLASSSSVNA